MSELKVTGSSGFIGVHLGNRLTEDGRSWQAIDLVEPEPASSWHTGICDVRDVVALGKFRSREGRSTVIHLAARAEVVIPFEAYEDLISTNVAGTISVADALDPSRLVLASTCSVYGMGHDRGRCQLEAPMTPVGLYGASKSSAEMICAGWALQRRRSAVVLRLGNVIGPGCRGLVEYLVAHCLRDPRARTPARLRGDGALIRDYVPVDFVVNAILAAASVEVPEGGVAVFNIGTGRGLSNRQVAETVRSALAGFGLEVELDFSLPREPQEAQRVVLDVDESCEQLGLPVVDEEDVLASVHESVASRVEKILTAQAAGPDSETFRD